MRQKGVPLCAIVVGVAAALAAPAGANLFGGLRGPTRFGPGGRGGPNPLANSQCVQNCGQLDSLCLNSARVDAQGCSDTKCSDARQAVTAACTADHGSAACQSAISALHTCLQPCRDALNAAASTCRNDRQACVANCATVVPSQPDPQCLVGCRTTLQSCRQATDTSSQSCYTECDAAITAAEGACTDPNAATCTLALQTAQACVRTCSQTEQTALQACVQASQTCIAGCPDVTPTPTPMPTATPMASSVTRLRVRSGH